MPMTSQRHLSQQRAVQLILDDHADMPGRLNDLGVSYLGRFKHIGEVSDQYSAISTFRKSATTFGPPSPRLHAARKWAQLCLPQMLTAYGVALGLTKVWTIRFNSAT